MVETAAAFRWDASSTEAAEVANRGVVRKLERLIKAGERLKVLAAIRRWPPADILSLFVAMRSKYARRLLEWMPDEMGIAVLAELDPRLHAVLAEEETRSTFRKLIEKMSPDEAFPLLDALPHGYALDLLEGHPHAKELRAALEVHEDLAAAHMRRGLLTAREGGTVGEVIADIRASADEIEQLGRVYVVDDAGRLKGVVRRRDLLMNPDATPISAIMQTDPVVVTAETDQEDVLALAKAQRIHNLAVVDADGVLLGGITPRELRQIADEEAEEDALLMGGVSPGATHFDSPLQIVRRRLPWILGGLVGASVAASVIGSYEDALTEAAILASFIPVVMATAGNVGIQASTMSIQAIGQGMTWKGDFLWRLGREVAASLVNGLVVGTVVACLVLLVSAFIEIGNAPSLALTCVLSLTLVTVIAGTFGSLIPFVLRAMKLDPAVATGIFITTSNDVFGVLIFFSIASAFYL
ncbi:magnesium transporter [Tropicimonas sediminicola]|uniref:Magnesium transporter MgtE n=1 Tax=Tropicimonas sediminicola TaxID=1031541 RepID=A0A239KEJ0_9RHOB|nr:magnesium transporter [Tropicimonas sediminicola]SNT16400.1 magnesium transporter [Tropicimonas sediminicola]